VRGERDRGQRTQLRRRICPRGVEQLVGGAAAGCERGHEPALALQPMSDVGVELGRRVEDGRAVAGTERGERPRAELLQAIEI
jgi:hypothetical protein